MIDEVIKSHIDALNANTEAINRLIAILSNSRAVAPAPGTVTVVPLSAPTAPSSPVSPAVTPAPAPMPAAPAPVATGTPAPTPAPTPAMTLEEVRNICTTAGAKGFTAVVVEFLAGQGVKKLNDLNPAMYPALIDFLKTKGAI